MLQAVISHLSSKSLATSTGNFAGTTLSTLIALDRARATGVPMIIGNGPYQPCSGSAVQQYRGET